jgi:hypothetical protein
MPEIGDILDVTIDDLSPEQLQQLKDAIDQFQLKCLMLFKKNRSDVPHLKNEMPRVLLSGETDATSLQEKEEALLAFQDVAEAVLGRHHKAFLSMFKQMMVGVFGLGMEQVFSRVSPHTYSAVVGETSSAQPTGAQPPLQSQPIQPPPQSIGSQPIQPPPQKRWKSASATSSTSRGGTASPATPTRKCRSTNSTAKPISAYIWGNGVRLVWSTAQFHLQNSFSH